MQTQTISNLKPSLKWYWLQKQSVKITEVEKEETEPQMV